MDSGSFISLLSAEFLSSIPVSQRSPLEKLTFMASSITGELVDNIGTVAPSLHIGNKSTQHKFFVARNITHSVVLGWDFIHSHKASITPTSFDMPGTTIPFVDRQQYQAPLKCKVALVGQAQIPPRCETHVQGRLSSPQFDIIPRDYDGYFEPALQDHIPVIGARSLFKPQDGLILVRLINPSDETVDLPADTCLGQFFSMTGNTEEEYTIMSVTDETSQVTDKSPAACVLPSSGLSKTEYEEAEQLLQAYRDIFSTSSQDIGQTDIIYHHIDTSSDTPIRQRAYRTSPAMRVEIQKQVDDLLDRGIVEESYSPWASPIVMVKKKDNTYRFCVDYRKLNAVTIRDSHPIPRQDDSIDSLSSSAYFSVMDLSSGYWQVKLNPHDKEKTAFTTGTGLYQFTVMPFGLVNAPMTFQRLMEAVLHGLHWSRCLVYLDDCIVMGKDFNDHLKNLQEVFQRFRDAGLKLKPSKCSFFRKEVTYLGHIISTEGVKPDPSNVEKVKSWPQPRTPTDVRSFLGLASFYRRFIHSFAKIATPLTTLTHKGQQFIWTAECEKAFQHLKEALTKPPLLAYPDFDKEFILSSDASLQAVGAVLSQSQDGKERVISYFSQTLSTTQKKWSTYDRELWAIVSAVRHFRHYLRHQHFTILTDHKPLLALKKFPIQDDASGKRTRWIVELNSYTFSLTHKKGQSHSNADALSRRPVESHITPRLPQQLPKRTVTHQACNAVETRSSKSRSSTDTPVQDDSTRQSAPKAPQPYHGVILDSDVDVQREQELDQDISTVIKYIDKSERPTIRQIRKHNPRLRRLLWQYPKLILQDGILYRKKKDKIGNLSLQLVVPNSLIPRVLQELHGDPSSGHFGALRTIQRAESMCYWPYMNKEITDFCNTCTACESFRLPTPKLQAPLHPITTTRPLEIVFADIAELPITRRGFRYILVVTDHFSKYVNIYPMKDQTAPTIAKLLFEEYVKEHGIPETLHTDQGRQFESRLVQELCSKLGIRKSRSTPYHPQGAGIVERCNRTIKDQLAKYISHQGGEWDTHINQVQLAYNTSIHATTGLTPYYVMHGREARTPANITCPTPPPSSGNTLLEYTTNLSERLRKAWEFTNQKTRRQQQQQKQQYDTKTRTVKYNRGDLVLLHDPTNSRNKLEPNWKGPFKVYSSSDDGLNYDIVDIQDERIKRRVHHNRLKLHRARAPQTMLTPPSPPATPPPSTHGTEKATMQYPPVPPADDETRRKMQSHQSPSHGPAYIVWSPRPPDNILHHQQSDYDQQPRSSLSVWQQTSNDDSAPIQLQPNQTKPPGQQPTQSEKSAPFQQHPGPSSPPDQTQPGPSSLADQIQSGPSSLPDQSQSGPSSPTYQTPCGPSSLPDQTQSRPSPPLHQTQSRPSSLVDQPQLRPQYQLRSTSNQSQLWPSSSPDQSRRRLSSPADRQHRSHYHLRSSTRQPEPRTSNPDPATLPDSQPTTSLGQHRQQENVKDSEQLRRNENEKDNGQLRRNENVMDNGQLHRNENATDSGQLHDNENAKDDGRLCSNERFPEDENRPDTRSRYGRRIRVPAKFQDYKL